MLRLRTGLGEFLQQFEQLFGFFMQFIEEAIHVRPIEADMGRARA